MPNNVMTHSISPGTVPTGIRRAIAVVLALWLALITGLGAAGSFVASPGSPPFAIAIGALAPIALFAAVYRISRAFRNFVLAADVRPMLAIQAWRFAGLAFIALYVHGVLPGMFAWPAGLGDMAVTSGPMAQLPLVLIPAYLVPIFVMLHLAALINTRHSA